MQTAISGETCDFRFVFRKCVRRFTFLDNNASLRSCCYLAVLMVAAVNVLGSRQVNLVTRCRDVK
jgi:hypothetical protein